MNGAQKPIDVIFTGLIRDYETFNRSLNDCALLQKKGLVRNIILSTWKGEPAKHPTMLPSIIEKGVLVIESDEPPVNKNSPYYRGRDFIWHQMKALEVGLKIIEEGTFVLKTRSDVYLDRKFVEKLAQQKEKLLTIKKPLPHGNIFKYKVWVPWFELTKPFFMADESFFGFKEDLEKLYNYNTDYFEKYDLGPDVHHVMRYIDPFLEKYPIFYNSMNKYNKDRSLKNFIKRNFPKLYEKLKRYSYLKKASEKSRFNTLSQRMEKQEFINLLAAYYYVLYSHFYIDLVSFKDQIVFREFYKGTLPRSDARQAEKNFTEKKVRFPGSGMIYFYEMGFINALIENKLRKTKLAKRFLEGIHAFEAR